jgi:catechol 2,3-dioxygenase-like lactoylglutathione lyase family enzyme
MEQRVSLITLGVDDLARARAFYEALGWRPVGGPTDVVFFQAGGLAVALWDRDKLAQDSAVASDGAGFGRIVLAYNVREPTEVDAVIEEARAAGARITREPGATFWGGYSAVFADPDGHLWEVAHNPHWDVLEDGSIRIETGRAP